MPAGFQVFDAAGQIVFDTGDFILREVTEISVAGAGSYDASGDALAANVLIGAVDQQDSETLTAPAFTTSGKTLQWTKADSGQSMNSTIRVMLF